MNRLALYTQHETAAALGTAKQRQRLEGETLAHGKRIQGFGQTVIFYPEFAFVGLIADRPSTAERGLIREVEQACDELYASSPFRALVNAVRSRLRKQWTLETVIGGLGRSDLAALRELHQTIDDLETRLAGQAISVRADVGRVLDATDGRFTIALVNKETVEVLPINASRAKISRGSWIARHQIQFGSRAGELLIPTVSPDRLPKEFSTGFVTPQQASPTAPSINPLARRVIAALERGAVSPEMSDVWGRGENRVYDTDASEAWAMTEPDPEAVLGHRRDRQDW